MSRFLKNDMACALVDYNQDTIPGIRKLADSIDRLPAEHAFDLIVCSHVIEHVAEPLHVIQALSQHLRIDGAIYVEVPMEIWARAPLQDEPVTHINFITPNSLWNLLHLAGLQPLHTELTGCLHPSGRQRHAIRAVAVQKRASSDSRKPNLRSSDVQKYLQPDLISVLRYWQANPQAFWHAVKDKLRFQ